MAVKKQKNKAGKHGETVVTTIRLESCNASRSNVRDEYPPIFKMDITGSVILGGDRREAKVLASYSLGAFYEGDDKPALESAFVYAVFYQLPKQVHKKNLGVRREKQLVQSGVKEAWPYFRQLLFSTFQRMGFPTPNIPPAAPAEIDNIENIPPAAPAEIDNIEKKAR